MPAHKFSLTIKWRCNVTTMDPRAELARRYFEEFLRERGLTWESLLALPETESRQLCIEASTYAALKMTEIEDKAKLAHVLHH